MEIRVCMDCREKNHQGGKALAGLFATLLWVNPSFPLSS